MHISSGFQLSFLGGLVICDACGNTVPHYITLPWFSIGENVCFECQRELEAGIHHHWQKSNVAEKEERKLLAEMVAHRDSLNRAIVDLEEQLGTGNG